MFLGTSYLEWSAVLSTALCIFLAGRNNVHTWWVGIIACILYGFLFFDAKLYADSSLQVFFVITGFIGWWNWSLSKIFKLFMGHEQTIAMSEPLPISKTPNKTWVLYAVVGSIVTMTYAALLYKFTDAAAPIADSLVLTLSVVAQLMLMKRRLENWPVWTVVNIISIPLYFSRELYLSAALYSFCLVNALVSWKHWLNLYDAEQESLPTLKVDRE